MKVGSMVLLAATLCGLFTACSDDSENAPVASAGKLIATVGVGYGSQKLWLLSDTILNGFMLSREIDDKEIWVLVDKDDAVGTYQETGYGDLVGPAPDAVITYNISSSKITLGINLC